MKTLEEIIDDAACEVHNGKLDFRHVPTEDFISWVEQVDDLPNYRHLDILSTMQLFEEQVLKSIATSL